jgi:hypothetical protein
MIAFAFLPIVWAAGATVGPFIGGSLARPSDRFPETFTSLFWIKYPYFLPCLVSASFTFCVIILTILFLKEVGQYLHLAPLFADNYCIDGTTQISSTLSTIREEQARRAGKLRSCGQASASPGVTQSRGGYSGWKLLLPRLLRYYAYGVATSVLCDAHPKWCDICTVSPFNFLILGALGGFGLDPATIGACLGMSLTHCPSLPESN